MNIEQRFTEALIQIFTRANQTGALVRIEDSLPIPSFDFPISQSEFFDYLKRADLSQVEIKSLIDLGTLYFKEIKEVLAIEMDRRKATDPDFSKQLSREFLPRLRKSDDPNWRYEP